MFYYVFSITNVIIIIPFILIHLHLILRLKLAKGKSVTLFKQQVEDIQGGWGNLPCCVSGSRETFPPFFHNYMTPMSLPPRFWYACREWQSEAVRNTSHHIQR